MRYKFVFILQVTQQALDIPLRWAIHLLVGDILGVLEVPLQDVILHCGIGLLL